MVRCPLSAAVGGAWSGVPQWANAEDMGGYEDEGVPVAHSAAAAVSQRCVLLLWLLFPRCSIPKASTFPGAKWSSLCQAGVVLALTG